LISLKIRHRVEHQINYSAKTTTKHLLAINQPLKTQNEIKRHATAK
jgi:hypothetical protein